MNDEGPGCSQKSMTIVLNGRASIWPIGSSLADVIDACEMAAESIATAVNGEFVGRDQRAVRRLQDGDSISCFQAIVGG